MQRFRFATFAITMAVSLPACAGVPELKLKERLDGSRDPVRIAAHRGASASAPENTTAAIARAIDAKADLVEFDVRATRDGELLLFHDKTLERYGGGKKPFADLSSEEALQLDVGSFFDAGFAAERPPTLAQAIQQCLKGNSIPLIEHKTGSAAAYSAVLRDLDVVDKVIVQSFDWEFLADLRALEPDLRLGALGKEEVGEKTLAKIAEFAPRDGGLEGFRHHQPGDRKFPRGGLRRRHLDRQR